MTPLHDIAESGSDPDGIFDTEHVMQARAALGAVSDIDVWVQRFDLLGDRTRLRILLCMHRAPGICVTDLSAALGMTATSVSHALRLLRNEGWVAVQRDGKKMTYRLDDDIIHSMLHELGATHAHHVTPNSGS